MENLWAPWRMEYISKEKEGQKEPCIFCNRLSQMNDKKNLILFRGDLVFIIMNKFPYNNGHLMVVPNRHTEDILGIRPEEQKEIFSLIQLGIKILNRVMNPHGFNIGMNLGRVSGAGITDHLHFHVVPRWNGDTNFMPIIGKTKVISEAIEKSYEKLHRAILGSIH
jgi:ATP adenylyltransferase